MIIDIYSKPKALWNFQVPFEQPKEYHFIKYGSKVKYILFHSNSLKIEIVYIW